VASLAVSKSGYASVTDQATGNVVYAQCGHVVAGYVNITVKYYQSQWEMSPAWATGLPANNGVAEQCGLFRHDCNAGTSEIVVTPSGELKCQRRSETIDADSTVVGSFVYVTN
jgi:hypothetical protein